VVLLKLRYPYYDTFLELIFYTLVVRMKTAHENYEALPQPGCMSTGS
jgi:hypothetical protein